VGNGNSVKSDKNSSDERKLNDNEDCKRHEVLGLPQLVSKRFKRSQHSSQSSECRPTPPARLALSLPPSQVYIPTFHAALTTTSSREHSHFFQTTTPSTTTNKHHCFSCCYPVCILKVCNSFPFVIRFLFSRR
jgi:hypothetical protein